jgi:hypothetical protein
MRGIIEGDRSQHHGPDAWPPTGLVDAEDEIFIHVREDTLC